MVDVGAQFAYKEEAPTGAVVNQEESDGNKKKSDETPEEIFEARSNQDAPSENIIVAAGFTRLATGAAADQAAALSLR